MKSITRYEIKKNNATKKFKVVKFVGHFKGKIFHIVKKTVPYKNLTRSRADEILFNLNKLK